VGAEALGFPGPDIDAELIIMCAELWKKLAIFDARLEIGTLGSAESRAAHRTKLIAYLERHLGRLDDDASRRLHSNPPRILDSKNAEMREIIEGAPRLLDDLDEDSLAHFKGLQHILREQGIEFEVNPRLVRGLDYYNRTVFEWVTDRLGAQGTICAGGRYDGLVEQIGGKPAPACGFAMGVERVLALLVECRGEVRPVVPDAYIIHQGRLANGFAWETARRLRDEGLKAVLHCGDGSFKSQMRKADASGARFAVIVGDDEAQAGEISIKPLREPAMQVRVGLAEAVDLLKRT
jgi:histidyl-tRNA synthetase